MTTLVRHLTNGVRLCSATQPPCDARFMSRSERVNQTDALASKRARHNNQASSALRSSKFLLTLIGSTAAAIAVFGKPIPSIAAAVVVIALAALAQGQSVRRAIPAALRPISQILRRHETIDQLDSPDGAGSSEEGTPANYKNSTGSNHAYLQ